MKVKVLMFLGGVMVGASLALVGLYHLADRIIP